MNSSVVHRDAMLLIVARADSFPDDVQDAFQQIESKLQTLRGRRFYGVTFRRPEGLEYFAGLVPESGEEPRQLGLPTLEIPAGSWARTRLQGWADKIDQIPALVEALVEEYGFDRSRPVMEYYRSSREMDVLVPVR